MWEIGMALNHGLMLILKKTMFIVLLNLNIIKIAGWINSDSKKRGEKCCLKIPWKSFDVCIAGEVWPELFEACKCEKGREKN